MFVKKPIGVGLVIGLLALAFTALPAMAQAAPTLKSGGKPLAVGSTLRATSTNVKTETEAGTLECSKVTLEGKVTENPGARVENGSGTGEGCHAGEAPVVITEIKIPFIQFNAGGTDEAGLTFRYDIFLSATEFVECHFEGTVATTWTNGSDIDIIDPSVLTGTGPAPCPAKGTISGEFTLETTTGAAVTVNE